MIKYGIIALVGLVFVLVAFIYVRTGIGIDDCGVQKLILDSKTNKVNSGIIVECSKDDKGWITLIDENTRAMENGIKKHLTVSK